MQYQRLKPYPLEKVRQLEEFKNLAKDYRTILVVDLENIPNNILTEIRKYLKEKGYVLKVGKKRIIALAFKEVGLDKLAEELLKINKSFGILFSNDNPFRVYKILSKKVLKTYAKGGEVAEEDIIVKKGPTDLTPGPVMSELARFKIRVRPVQGRLEVIQDVKVLDKGKVISKELANILRKLKIKTVSIRLDAIFAYEDGIIIKKEDLAIDEEVYKSNIKEAFEKALLLSLGIYYPLKENIEIMLRYLYRLAENFAIEIGYVTKDNIKEVIRRAYSIASKIKEKLNV